MNIIKKCLPIMQKKHIKVFGFTVDEYVFGEIKSLDAIITLTNYDIESGLPSPVYFLSVDCFNCLNLRPISFKEIDGAKIAFDAEKIDTPIQLYQRYGSKTSNMGIDAETIIVSTSREKLYALRKKLIENALEDLTHAKAITRLRKQLAELEEENSDET